MVLEKKNETKILLRKRKGNGLPLGVSIAEKKYIQFSIALPKENKCTLCLYQQEMEQPFAEIELDSKYKIGGIFSIQLYIGEEWRKSVCYSYKIFDRRGNKEKEILDPYAKKIVGREKWGENIELSSEERKKKTKAALSFGEGKNVPIVENKLPFEEMILYQLHVRGFTKDHSSKVKNKGTFLGMTEKISYLKDLGINALLLMPCYEFDEVMEKDRVLVPEELAYLNLSEQNKKEHRKINYWGYVKEANYFAPKASYAKKPDQAEQEMKAMIQKFHENHIEIFMEMWFVNGTNQTMIVDCLRYWVLEYGIDGFKINNDVVHTNMVATDPILANTKFLTNGWDQRYLYGEEQCEKRVLGEFNDGFMVDARRYLKGDEGQVAAFLNRFKKNPNPIGVVNYISNANTFTLMDMVSYDIKHNEENGEDGRDGTEYNYSWNCGYEGPTRKKQVVQLRMKQLRNAILMLLLSMGTPMILAGDEFGNSQNGNNNAYCQDNPIGWVNWKKNTMNKYIFDFYKYVIHLRKNHPIFRRSEEFRCIDYVACGYPDISFHGTKAWFPDTSNYSRVLGMMLCGKYAPINKRKSDDFFYLAFNMHWEPHSYDLPKLPKEMHWKVLIDTAENILPAADNAELKNQRVYEVKPRSIVVFIGKKMSRQKNIKKE